MQANVVRPQLPHEFKTRQIIIQSGANVWPHEMKTAEALAAAGRTVEFIRRSEEQRTTSADAIIDGIVWEMKAPKASNLKAIEKNLRKALDQSNCVILVIIAAEMLRRSRLRCCGVPRCAATR